MRAKMWWLLIFCWLVGLQPIPTFKEYADMLTHQEKVRIQVLWLTGRLDEKNIRQFYERFVLAPNRDSAIEHALDKSFTASLDRHWEWVKKVINIPGLLKEHYEGQGFLKGTWGTLKTFVLVPFRAWYEIFAGNKGLGHSPFVTLCGAATLILLILGIADLYFDWFYYW